jgi:Rrf2 family transcriptional regulator, iron-sulfur cluster assembly transcription factor
MGNSSSRCITHDLWAELSHQIHLFLGSVSLGDVINGRVTASQGRPDQQAISNAAD